MTRPTHYAERAEQAGRGGWARWTVWVAGLVVALGAGVATAHGLYEVALAAGTPRVLAWLYPLITDGLALVAYATTTRLAERGRRYAWTVVVIAAGLSGLTQASYLAGGVASAPPGLRFAIGAWPAIAAAVVAHLLFLLGANLTTTGSADLHQQVSHLGQPDRATRRAGNEPALAGGSNEPLAAAHCPAAVSVTGQSSATSTSAPVVLPPRTTATPPLDATPGGGGPPRAVQPTPRQLVQPLTSTPSEQASEHPAAPTTDPVVRAPTARDAAPARLRAQTAATGHAARHGQLPTVSELMALAQVARGTAATALKDLRTQQDQLQITTTTNEARTKR
jgi:hypothetical protein